MRWRLCESTTTRRYSGGLFPGGSTGFAGYGFGNMGCQAVGYGLGRVFGFEHQNREFREFGEIFFGRVQDSRADREWEGGTAGYGEPGDNGDHGDGGAAGGIGDAVAAAGFLQGPDCDATPGAVMLGQRQG